MEELLNAGTLETGQGSIRLPKKELPILVPMVRLVLEGFVWTHGTYAGEKITPTGAAILKAFGKSLNEVFLVSSKMGFSYPVLSCEESQCFTLQLSVEY